MKAKKDRPEKKLVINVPPTIQRISTLDIIKRAALVWLDKKSFKKKPAKDASHGMPNMSAWSNVFNFAIVIDDDVVDVMRVQPRMATWLQSNPKFILFDPTTDYEVMPGFKYSDGKFINPNISLDIKPQEFKFGEKNEK